ncbi:MAG TPA: RNA polymerase sigma factor [Bacteroidales bacterium]|nr:RNA polymerase sigma factor [Bacteroidales bacterium]
MDDKALMAAVIAGDPEKLGILYERYKMPLYSYFYKFTGGNKHSSEDLVQTVFYRVLKYKEQYRGTGTFVGWLFTIAHNTGIDFHKAENRKPKASADLREIKVYADSLQRDEESALLLKALGKLKPDDKEVLILSKMECLKYSEIAVIMNCNENAIKARVLRALNRLKQIYLKLENA